MKKCFVFLFLILHLAPHAQERPKLVVGLVVDQMRWDFLYRYYNRYAPNGFKRLLTEGFSCENTMIPYTPTYTAAGHSCVYTGSVPALHGIMGNNWYDKAQKKVVYCTDDFLVQGVGSGSAAGKMSPRNMWSTTITDELRLATNFRNKTIAIALKDRGAILPGGHTANAAYWFDNTSGGWISSTFYMQQLPAWVQTFNNRKLPDGYLQQNWNTLLPISTYTQSTADSNAYENKLGGVSNSFPHITANLVGTNKYEVFKATPFGDSYTLEMAKAAIDGEQLGKSGFTDFLAISLSSPDYVGHSFGPNSIEIEDAYLRLDKEMALFFSYLDKTIGKGQYLFFLTADHGVAHNSTFLTDRKIPAGVFDNVTVQKTLADGLQKQFGVPGIVSSFINSQFYLNDSLIIANKLDKKEIKNYIRQSMLQYAAISHVLDVENIANETLPQKLKNMLANSYNQKLSGDLQVIYKPQWFENWRLGTTHGLWNPYDAHIPLVFMGWGIKPGKLNREVYMSDIAPTLGALLKIQMPNASIGDVITEVISIPPSSTNVTGAKK